MKNSVLCLVVLALLSACASAPILPLRPTATSAEGAACLRQCDGSYVNCTNPSEAGRRTSIASYSPAGVLFGAMADSSARSDAQKTCAEFLKHCYSDCENFK